MASSGKTYAHREFGWGTYNNNNVMLLPREGVQLESTAPSQPQRVLKPKDFKRVHLVVDIDKVIGSIRESNRLTRTILQRLEYRIDSVIHPPDPLAYKT